MGVGAASHEANEMRRQSGPEGASAPVGTDESRLFAWVEQVCGGRILSSAQTSGGNRARSWAIDVADAGGQVKEVFLRYGPPRPPGVEPYTIHREAQVYRAIATLPIRAPRLIAEHPDIEAILTDRATGIAEFRRLKDPVVKQSIAREVMADLARLHAHPVDGVALSGGGSGPRIRDHVRAELAIWRAMYDETGRPDGLLDLAFRWLDDNIPDPDGPVVLVHGDAGPGNFLFEDGRLTALIDWELAHLGDPMEDLAWFSMRCVMEPVPDFAASLKDYGLAGGTPVSRNRILYHRVLVSTRVVVIRHRNVTGEPAHAIVSNALNRRLLVEALSDASGVSVNWPKPIEAEPTDREALYSRILDDLRDVVVARSTDGQVIAKAKNAAKVLKYLEAWDRIGEQVDTLESDALVRLMPSARDLTLEAARTSLAQAVRSGQVPFGEALDFFAGKAARDAQLATGASGGIAHRHYPKLALEHEDDR
ncbi:MAG: putative aminoglycoside phosphotransferase [Enterovirga sp.]|nr:putative aminoglycoside phosphotransferase [Enterovirga sp.]